MSSIKTKDYLVFFLCKNIAAILGNLPNGFFILIEFFLVKVAVLFARKDRRIIYANIHRVYALPAFSNFSKRFATQCLASNLRSSLETLRGIHNFDRLKLLGLEDVRVELEKLGDGPGIFITSHLGSWELAGGVLARASQKKFYGLAKPAKNSGLSRFLNSVRERLGIHVIWTGKPSLMKEMMAVLKSGNLLGFVMDQKPGTLNSPIVPFFGIPTPFVSGPASMALHFKAPIYSIHVVREGAMTFRVILKSIAYSESLSPLALTEILAQELERVIRIYPEQWSWNYKRWKSKANEVLSNVKQST